MSFLDQLWDDTVAGPRPDNGLGRLRKYPSFSSNPPANSPNKGEVEGGKGVRSEEVKSVTRSIMIVKPPGYVSPPPVSPASSSTTPPVSPFSGGGKNSSWRRRRSLPDADEIAPRLKDNQPSSVV